MKVLQSVPKVNDNPKEKLGDLMTYNMSHYKLVKSQ